MRNRDNWQADCFSKNRANRKCKVDFTFVKRTLHCQNGRLDKKCRQFLSLYKKYTAKMAVAGRGGTGEIREN